MPSLTQLERHSPLLFIDAASSQIQVGLLASGGNSRWETSGDEAGVAVFECIRKLGVDPGQIAAFAYCEGPGSVLGVRTSAMALRTWAVLKPRPMYAYCSLALVAHALRRPEVAVIADARREAWHHYQMGRGLRRVPTAEIGDGEFVMPENFRHWAPLPSQVGRVPYSLAQLLPRVAGEDLFRATTGPDAFLHEEPSYVTWTPRIHRAPSER